MYVPYVRYVEHKLWNISYAVQWDAWDSMLLLAMCASVRAAELRTRDLRQRQRLRTNEEKRAEPIIIAKMG